jgi:hypothetical protein
MHVEVDGDPLPGEIDTAATIAAMNPLGRLIAHRALRSRRHGLEGDDDGLLLDDHVMERQALGIRRERTREQREGSLRQPMQTPTWYAIYYDQTTSLPTITKSSGELRSFGGS